MIRLEARPRASKAMRYLSPVIAAALTAVCGIVFSAFAGLDPLETFHAFFISPIDDRYGLGELGVKAAPLMLIATGLAIGFRSNVWNIGAEGQLTLGAVCGGGLALAFHASQSAWLLPAAIIAGAVGGMLWAAIPALLRTRFNTNEILVSLMLNYVAVLLLSYLVHGPWRDPEGFNFPESRLFPDAALLPVIAEDTRLHLGFVLAIAVLLIGWLFVARSFIGYQMRVAGLAGGAADYAGFNRARMIWIGLLTGGAMAGIAGMSEVSGPMGQITDQVSSNYGFAAIIVAFVARLNPVGIFFASLLMALLYLGGEQAQQYLNLPSSISLVFQGMLLLFLLGSDVFINYRLRWKGATA